MGRRSLAALIGYSKVDQGQAVAELPVVMFVVIIVIFGLMELAITARANIAASQAATSIARVACVSSDGTGVADVNTLKTYAKRHLLALGNTHDLDTVDVSITGNAASDLMSVKVTLKQKGIPSLRWGQSAFVQLYTASATVHIPGVMRGAEGAGLAWPTSYGMSQGDE